MLWWLSCSLTLFFTLNVKTSPHRHKGKSAPGERGSQKRGSSLGAHIRGVNLPSAKDDTCAAHSLRQAHRCFLGDGDSVWGH